MDEQHRRARARERGRNVGVGPVETRDLRFLAGAQPRTADPMMPCASLREGRPHELGHGASRPRKTARTPPRRHAASRPAATSATDAPYETPSSPTRDTSQPRRCRSSSTCDRSRDFEGAEGNVVAGRGAVAAQIDQHAAKAGLRQAHGPGRHVVPVLQIAVQQQDRAARTRVARATSLAGRQYASKCLMCGSLPVGVFHAAGRR